MTGDELLSGVKMFLSVSIVLVSLPALIVTWLRKVFAKEEDPGDQATRIFLIVLSYPASLLLLYGFAVFTNWKGEKDVSQLFVGPLIPALAAFAYGTLVSLAVALFSANVSPTKKHPGHHFTLVIGFGSALQLILLFANIFAAHDMAKMDAAAQQNSQTPALPADSQIAETDDLRARQFDAMLDQLEAKSGRVNPKSNDYDQQLVNQLESQVAAYEKQGIPSANALKRAVKELLEVDLYIPPAKATTATQSGQYPSNSQVGTTAQRKSPPLPSRKCWEKYQAEVEKIPENAPLAEAVDQIKAAEARMNACNG